MSKLILAVEDQEDNMQILRDLLVNAGYEMLEAHTGEEGVARTHDSQPDVILMDLQLPGINGTQALRLIRNDASGADVPVVALTAFAMAEDRDRALLDGFDGYLSKPISVRELPHQVAGFLREKHDDD